MTLTNGIGLPVGDDFYQQNHKQTIKYSRPIGCYRLPANRCIYLATFYQRSIFAGETTTGPGRTNSLLRVCLRRAAISRCRRLRRRRRRLQLMASERERPSANWSRRRRSPPLISQVKSAQKIKSRRFHWHLSAVYKYVARDLRRSDGPTSGLSQRPPLTSRRIHTVSLHGTDDICHQQRISTSLKCACVCTCFLCGCSGVTVEYRTYKGAITCNKT